MKLSPFVMFLIAALPLIGATSSRPQSVDLEVTRVKSRLQEIQSSGGSSATRTQKQRALIDGEIARASAQLRELEADVKKESKASASGTTENSRAATQAARERRKQAIDNLQKFLEILRSMKAQL